MIIIILSHVCSERCDNVHADDVDLSASVF